MTGSRRALLVLATVTATALGLFLALSDPGDGKPARPPAAWDATRALEPEVEGTADVAELAGERVAQGTPASEELVETRAEATLVVRVIARGSGEPLPRTRIVAREDRDDQDANVELVEASEGDLLSAPLTDDSGVARLRLPAGAPLVLDVVGDPRVAGSARRELRSLSAEEERHLEIALDMTWDLRFHGRVVADESGEPITHAQVEIVGSARDGGGLGYEDVYAELETDAWGTFFAVLPSWWELEARVTVPGRIVVSAPVGPRHEHLDTARLIRVPRGSTLAVHVVGKDVDTSDLDLELETDGGLLTLSVVELDAKSRTDDHGRTDETGRCTLRVLPGREHELRVSRGRYQLASQVVPALEPGEKRSVDVTLFRGLTVRGALVDVVTRAPIPDRMVWLVSSLGPRHAGSGSRRYLGLHERPVAAAATNEIGDFVLHDVQPGMWLLGPAPSEGGDVAPFAQIVYVREEMEDLELGASRGLSIRGRVIAFGDEPVTDTVVVATYRGQPVHDLAHVGQDGVFELGPLWPGDHVISAYGPGESISEPLRVKAGTTSAVVYLLRTGSVHATFIDQTGERLDGRCQLESRGGERVGFARTDGGRVVVTGLSAGPWQLVFHTEDGLFATERNIPVRAGHAYDLGSVVAQPGGELVVRVPESQRGAHFYVTKEGHRITDVPHGTAVRVPAGKLSLYREGAWRSFRVEAIAGERVELKLTEEDF